MAVTFVQKTSGQTGPLSLTVTISLPSAPAAGNLLVFAMGGDKSLGLLTLAGFTQAASLLSGSVTLDLYWKISNGTEGTIIPLWVTVALAGNTYWYGEFSDPAVSAPSTWVVSAAATNLTNETNTTSWPTGTTLPAVYPGLALASMAIDSANSVTDGTTAWSGGYTPLFTTTAAAGDRGALYLATNPTASGATAGSTFSYAGSGDQMTGSVTVFTKLAVGPVTGSGPALAAAGTSLAASTALSVGAAVPAATGAAPGAVAAVSSAPGCPSAVGTALDATALISVSLGCPSGSGTALDASVALAVGTDSASGEGTTPDVTPDASSPGLALAELPEGSGTALDASVAVTVGAGEPEGGASGYGPEALPAVTAPAGSPDGAGGAAETTAGLLAQPDTAEALGGDYSALAAALEDTAVTAGLATAEGDAQDAEATPPQVPFRQRARAAEPCGRTAGKRPVSSWSGREPDRTIEGSELGY